MEEISRITKLEDFLKGIEAKKYYPKGLYLTSFINCMTLYQGHGQVASAINLLPQELLQEICCHVLPATPILAKMAEISIKVFRAQSATLKLADTSNHVKQLDQALETALAAKTFMEKAAKIKTAINDFLQQELELMEPKKFIQSPTVALLCKYHLLTENRVHQNPNQSHIPHHLSQVF